MKDLTRGKPWKVLLMFAIPLVLSGLIQQLYNMADSLIVGNFASVENGGISGVNALAAVGASSTITMLFISLGNGGSMGCGVVISQMFGGKRFGEVKTTLYTSLIFFCGLAVVMMIAGSLLAGPMTGWMNTPAEFTTRRWIICAFTCSGCRFCSFIMYATPFSTPWEIPESPCIF